MRSRAGRLTLGAVAVLVVGAAAAFLINSEQPFAGRLAALRAFDVSARETSEALADLRSAQGAYVAEGQGVTFWMPKVAATTEGVTNAIAALRQAALDADARSSLDQASTSVNEFTEIDKRARDYLKSGQPLMAGDVIFTEGVRAAAAAGQSVEAARVAEQRAFDASEALLREQEAIVAGGAAGVVLLLLVVMAVAAPVTRTAATDVAESSLSIAPAPPATETSAANAQSARLFIQAAAELATEMGRARDLDDLERLLGRAAEVMDADGLIVWVGSTTGADLRPVLAHGYSPPAIARMPTVPRSADNAAAAAYRTGSLRIVLARPGEASGAIVAPILTPDGCVGAVSAEVKRGGETSEATQALAALLAAQLANVIGVQEVIKSRPATLAAVATRSSP